MLFATEINEFKQLIKDLSNMILTLQEKQTGIAAEVQYIRQQLSSQGRKFQACATAFRQTKQVCEELTERICEASGVLSNIDASL